MEIRIVKSLCVLLLLSLSACGGSGGSDSSENGSSGNDSSSSDNGNGGALSPQGMWVFLNDDGTEHSGDGIDADVTLYVNSESRFYMEVNREYAGQRGQNIEAAGSVFSENGGLVLDGLLNEPGGESPNATRIEMMLQHASDKLVGQLNYTSPRTGNQVLVDIGLEKIDNDHVLGEYFDYENPVSLSSLAGTHEVGSGGGTLVIDDDGILEFPQSSCDEAGGEIHTINAGLNEYSGYLELNCDGDFLSYEVLGFTGLSPAGSVGLILVFLSDNEVFSISVPISS